MRSFILASLGLVLLHGQAQSEPRLLWSAYDDANGSFGLSYAYPESDVGLLWIWCEAATGIIEVTPGPATSVQTEGEQGRIVLTAPSKTLVIEGRANWSKTSNSMLISGKISDLKGFASLFKQRGSLKITVPGNHVTVPLDKVAQSAFAEFSKHCPSLRPAN